MQTQKYYEILVAMRSQALVLQEAPSTCEKAFSKSATFRGDADPTPSAAAAACRWCALGTPPKTKLMQSALEATMKDRVADELGGKDKVSTL